MEVVSCEEIHAGEVTKAFFPDEEVVFKDPNRVRIEQDACDQWGEDYVGTDILNPTLDLEAIWFPQYQGRVWFHQENAPNDQASGTRRWRVCVVKGNEPYTGTLKDGQRFGTPRNPLNSFCGSGKGSDYAPTSCTEPHEWEVLAWFNRTPERYNQTPAGSPIEVPGALEECLSYAERMLASTDPETTAKLKVGTDSLEGLVPTAEQVDFHHTKLLQTPSCYVEVADGSLLTGSVIGIGSNPLPLA